MTMHDNKINKWEREREREKKRGIECTIKINLQITEHNTTLMHIIDIHTNSFVQNQNKINNAIKQNKTKQSEIKLRL